jgi:MmyB-like transcription regulator ligand binding domain
MTGTPALVQNGRLDILHANQLGSALFSEIFRDPVRPANSAASSSWTLARPSSTSSGRGSPTTSWPSFALRPDATPYDRALSDLIGELSTRSEEFRVRIAGFTARPDRAEAAVKPATPRRNIRFRPKMSPSRPPVISPSANASV